MNTLTECFLQCLIRPLGSVLCVRWAHHGRYLASGSDDKIVVIWDLDPYVGRFVIYRSVLNRAKLMLNLRITVEEAVESLGLTILTLRLGNLSSGS